MRYQFQSISAFAAAALLASVAAFPSTVRASEPDHDAGVVSRTVTHDTAWYPDAENGLVLLYGPTMSAATCLDEGFPTAVESRVERPNGATFVHTQFHGETFHVYESVDPWSFLDEQCEYALDDDPFTEVAEPVLSGTGTLVLQWQVGSDGSLGVQNWVVGRAESPAGESFTVRSRAVYDITPEGDFLLDVLEVVIR